jgi:AbrB family looped-hinge helix DNA binding protein
MSTAKLTQKYQATIPQEIRKFLGLIKGDTLSFEVLNGKVLVKKASPVDIEYTKALESTLSEWDNPADDEAYNDL